MKQLHSIDRASGQLDAQLLSSVTVGSFTMSNLSLLGSQTWDTPSGEQAIISMENEQILCTMAESGGTLTVTIVTRGYNGTTAATHAANTIGYIRMTSAHYEIVKDEVAKHVTGLIAYDGTTPAVTSATVLTVSGSDETAKFTAGRAVLVKISSTWHRCIIRSSSFSTNTTVNVTSDTLPSSGTIVDIGFELRESVNKPVDYQLIKEATNVPASSPPSGYIWLFAKGKGWYGKDSDGKVRPLGIVQATASSAAGVLTLDWGVANVYDCTLTENITGVTHSNGVEGEAYTLRLKQHASAAKTVVLGTSGGTRFSSAIASFTMTTTVSAYDVLMFLYNGTDSKYDLLKVVQGFQASPSQSPTIISAAFNSGAAVTANDALYVKASDGKVYKTDADADESTYSFIGFAYNSVAGADEAVTVYLPGSVMDGFTSLTVGESLYLSGTAGAIANTPDATREARVALAVSATKVLILSPKFVRRGSQNITSATTFAQTCGFYPAKVHLWAYSTGGGWTEGDERNYCHGITAVNQSYASLSLAWYTADASPGNVSKGTISAKSQTSFTLNATQADTSNTTIYWEAEN